MTQHTDQLDAQHQTATTCPQDTSRESPHQVPQEKLRERYLEQQRRLACPGCGESPFLG